MIHQSPAQPRRAPAEMAILADLRLRTFLTALAAGDPAADARRLDLESMWFEVRPLRPLGREEIAQAAERFGRFVAAIERLELDTAWHRKNDLRCLGVDVLIQQPKRPSPLGHFMSPWHRPNRQAAPGLAVAS